MKWLPFLTLISCASKQNTASTIEYIYEETEEVDLDDIDLEDFPEANDDEE